MCYNEITTQLGSEHVDGEEENQVKCDQNREYDVLMVSCASDSGGYFIDDFRARNERLGRGQSAASSAKPDRSISPTKPSQIMNHKNILSLPGSTYRHCSMGMEQKGFLFVCRMKERVIKRQTYRQSSELPVRMMKKQELSLVRSSFSSCLFQRRSSSLAIDDRPPSTYYDT